MDIKAVLEQAISKKASDIYIIENIPISIKVNKTLTNLLNTPLTKEDTHQIIIDIYKFANRTFDITKNDDDFALSLPIGRFRINIYKQKGSYSSVIRLIPLEIPDYRLLNIPETIINLSDYKRGLVLFTGATGSGKTTTLACVLDKINKEKDNHIITIEDPIEYIHNHKKSIISQREIGIDTTDYVSTIKFAMRQAPDVLLVGEMRDYEAMSATLTAAEAGHLIFATLHTMSASSTIDRILNAFPADQQNQVRTQLAGTLQAIVSCQLIPTKNQDLYPVYEIMIANSSIRSTIREGKTFQLDNILQTSGSVGMKTMDMSISDLLKKDLITRETALEYANNTQFF